MHLTDNHSVGYCRHTRTDGCRRTRMNRVTRQSDILWEAVLRVGIGAPALIKPEEASTRKSVRPTTAMFLWLVALTFWPFDPKLNWFPGLIVDHFCVKFGDHSSVDFWDIVRPTTGYLKPLSSRLSSVKVIKKEPIVKFYLGQGPHHLQLRMLRNFTCARVLVRVYRFVLALLEWPVILCTVRHTAKSPQKSSATIYVASRWIRCVTCKLSEPLFMSCCCNQERWWISSWKLWPKAPSAPATMSKQHCRMLQVLVFTHFYVVMLEA